jgi:hypothetical protein
MLVKYVLSDGISQAFLPFRFVDVIVITNHHLFMLILPGKYIQVLSISHKMADYFAFPLLKQ